MFAHFFTIFCDGGILFNCDYLIFKEMLNKKGSRVDNLERSSNFAIILGFDYFVCL